MALDILVFAFAYSILIFYTIFTVPACKFKNNSKITKINQNVGEILN